MHALKGLATSIATHIDVINNPRRGARKLNPRFHLFSVTIKIFVHIVSVLHLFLFTLLRTTDNKVQLAITQDLTEVSRRTLAAVLRV